MEIALYQPDIPQNTGTIIRFTACMNGTLHIIEPAGFNISDRALRRAGLDYINKANLISHISFAKFREANKNKMIVLLTTKSSDLYTDFKFQNNDILLLGRESCGVPEEIHNAVDARIKIPMIEGFRSINIAMACAMVSGEYMRQCDYVV